jgi:hypothetical protein
LHRGKIRRETAEIDMGKSQKESKSGLRTQDFSDREGQGDGIIIIGDNQCVASRLASCLPPRKVKA